MRKIMILNAKGGSGKTTVATNLAAYYASKGRNVVLADFDPQGSSMKWLEERPKGRPIIKGVAAYEGGSLAARGVDVMVMDAPASIHGKDLEQYARKAETFIVPVLPSPIDMRAAIDFIKDFKNTAAVKAKKAKFCVIANRARGNTNIFLELDEMLDGLRGVPYITALRETQNYIRAAQKGLGVFEFAPGATGVDREEWQPLIEWLGSKKSY